MSFRNLIDRADEDSRKHRAADPLAADFAIAIGLWIVGVAGLLLGALWVHPGLFFMVLGAFVCRSARGDFKRIRRERRRHRPR